MARTPQLPPPAPTPEQAGTAVGDVTSTPALRTWQTEGNKPTEAAWGPEPSCRQAPDQSPSLLPLPPEPHRRPDGTLYNVLPTHGHTDDGDSNAKESPGPQQPTCQWTPDTAQGSPRAPAGWPEALTLDPSSPFSLLLVHLPCWCRTAVESAGSRSQWESPASPRKPSPASDLECGLCNATFWAEAPVLFLTSRHGRA